MNIHDMAADWSWMDEAIGFKIKGSSVVWEEASYGPRGGLMIQRLVVTPEGKLKPIRQYAIPTQEVTLVTKED